MKYWYVDLSLIVLGLGAIALVHVLRFDEPATLERDATALRADAVTGVATDAADCRVTRITDGERSYTLSRGAASPACDASRVSPPHP